MSEKQWKNYEEVATYLLNKFASHFGVGRVEGKQLVPGISGTEWEIDAKGCSNDEGHFIIVECKRYTKNGVSQAIAAGLAWIIQDSGASGGIIVTPIGLQEGAKKVAAKAGIHEVLLKQDATTTDYVLEFLNQVCLGFSNAVNVSIAEKLTITVKDKDGNILEERAI